MSQRFRFVEGDAIKKVNDSEERKRIRSSISKAAHASRRSQRVTASEVQNVPGHVPIRAAPHMTLRSAVSTTRRDPFASTGLLADDDFSQGVLDYCMTELWPSFRPYSDYGITFVRHWLPSAAQIAPVMAAIIFTGYTHRQLRVQEMREVERVLTLKGEALTSMRATMMRGIPYDTIDAMIFAILSLAVNVHASIDHVVLPEKTVFSRKLEEDQWVSLYAQLRFDSSHFAAIVALIRRKGGIQNVSLYGSGWLVFFAGLMGAAVSLTEPPFPPTGVIGQPYIYESPLRLLRVFNVPWHFAREGFRMFESIGMGRDHIQTFLDLSEMSQALEICINKAYDKSMLTSVLDSRAHLVYRLLKLPRDAADVLPDTPADETAFLLYQCARCVALAYSLRVIFPLPQNDQNRSALMPQIVNLIEMIISSPSADRYLEFLLWSSVVAAAVTALDDHEISGVFREYVFRLLEMSDIQDCAEMKSLLRVFGWIDSACEDYTDDIWSEFRSRQG